MAEVQRELTPEERQALHDDRAARVAAAMDGLPPAAAEFVRRWRRCVELSGRAGRCGSALPMLEAFVADVAALVGAAPERVAGAHASGEGV